MPWAQWDTQGKYLLAVVNDLPESIRNMSPEQIVDLGYYPLDIIFPEDTIHRFPQLSGGAHYELIDNRIVQTFPNADFSVAAVRAFLTTEVERSLQQTMYATDWYFIRALDTGTPVPEPIKILRQRQRTHLDWLRNQIATLDERSLVEFQWMWPTRISEVMQNGVPIIYDTVTPTEPLGEQIAPGIGAPNLPLGEILPPPDPEAKLAYTHLSPDLNHPIGLLDQEIGVLKPGGPTPLTVPPELQPVPPTTDGPVPLLHDPSLPPIPEPANGVPREINHAQ